METYDQELQRIKAILRGTTKGLTVTEISRSIKINRNSVAKYLDILLTSGQVEMKAVGSAKMYSLTKRVPVSTILSLSSDYIFVLDNTLTITYVNDNVLNFEKISAENIVGKTADSVPISFFSVPDILALIKESIAGNEIIRELEVRKDSQSFFFRAKFVPSILENRKKGLLLILEDITEIRQYQKTLENTVAEQDKELTTSYKELTTAQEVSREVKGAFEESERRYRNLIELAQEGVWTIDAEGRTTFTNRKLSEILGYNAEEMLQQPVFGFVSEKNRAALKKNIARLKSGESQFFTVTFTKKDGSPVYTRLAASPGLDESGAYAYGLFLVSDISELKKADDAVRQSELYYRTLVETSPSGVITMTPEGHIQTANVQAVRLLGYQKLDDLLGRNLFDYIAPNDIEKCNTTLSKAAEKGSTKSTECTLISNDSTGFCAELNISTIRNPDSTISAFVCILTDITERRKAEYLIRKSEEKHRALVEGISNIVFTTDAKGKLTYVSPVIQTLLGYDPSDLTGNHFYKLAPPDERYKIGLMLKNALSDKTGPEEFRMIDKAGNLHIVRIVAQPYKDKGRLAGINGLIEDVTDLKKAEHNLKKIELQYRAVVEDQTDLICRFRPDFSISFVNPAFLRYYQKPEGDALNVSLLSFVSKNEQEQIREIIATLTPERPVKTFEHGSVSPKGTAHAYHTTIRAIYNAQREAIEFQSSSRDITELKQYYEQSQHLLEELQLHQAELESQNEELIQLRKKAERSERKYLDLYDFAPAGYFTLGRGGVITGVNLTGAAMLGKSRDSVLNQQLQNFIALEHQENFIAFCKRVFGTSRKQKCEIALMQPGSDDQLVIQADGKRIEQEPDAGQQCRIVMTDITERVMADRALQQSENLLKRMINGSPVPIFVIDKNHRVTYWNTAMQSCTGIPAKDVIGTNQHWKGFYTEERPCLSDLIVEGDYEKIPRLYPKIAFKSQLIDGAYEAVNFFPTMGERGKWLHFTVSPVYDTKKNIIAALETFIDITDLKLAEETIKSANKKLNTLTSITRHDIINQLTILLTYIEYLEEELPADPEIRKHATNIRNAANAIQNIVVFTREYQSLGMEMACWYDLARLMEKIIANSDARSVTTQIDTKGVKIYADPLIERVFENLVDNAIRHGGNVTEIGISFNEANGGGTIVFSDNGVGVPADQKTRIFAKDAGQKKRFGLFLSKEILNYHGISIRENGEPGKGARFEIDVPKSRYTLSS